MGCSLPSRRRRFLCMCVHASPVGLLASKKELEGIALIATRSFRSSSARACPSKWNSPRALGALSVSVPFPASSFPSFAVFIPGQTIGSFLAITTPIDRQTDRQKNGRTHARTGGRGRGRGQRSVCLRVKVFVLCRVGLSSSGHVKYFIRELCLHMCLLLCAFEKIAVLLKLQYNAGKHLGIIAASVDS